MIKLLCLLAVVVHAQASGYGSTLDSLVDLTEQLEADLQELNAEISNAATLTAVADEQINHIVDSVLPLLRLTNSQQDELIDEYLSQVKKLMHRKDEAEALAAEAKSTAEGTNATLASQEHHLLESEAILDEQHEKIQNLTDLLAECKEQYFSDLNDTIGDLNKLQEDLADAITSLANATDSRKCEYGFGAFSPNALSHVTFKTKFDEVPDVALSLAGFTAHLDVHSYDAYDRISLNKAVHYITEEGFDIAAADLSKGMVEFKYIFCVWMACQNLDGN